MYQFGIRSLFVVASAVCILLSVVLLLHRATRQSETLLQAARDGDIQTVEHVLRAALGNPNVRDSWNTTPLHYAASRGHLDIVKALVAAGASVDDTSRGDNTALVSAAANGHLHVVAFLVSVGANANDRNADGKTAQDVAAENGHQDVVTFLRSSTSLIRLNPQEQPAAGETLRPAVLGEAAKSPAEKKSP